MTASHFPVKGIRGRISRPAPRPGTLSLLCPRAAHPPAMYGLGQNPADARHPSVAKAQR